MVIAVMILLEVLLLSSLSENSQQSRNSSACPHAQHAVAASEGEGHDLVDACCIDVAHLHLCGLVFTNTGSYHTDRPSAGYLGAYTAVLEPRIAPYNRNS